MACKPFLKWAGGKRWLVSHPNFELPSFNGRYIEPFVGSGAVFFQLSPDNAILSDINARLIETYRAIQQNWTGVWSALKRHQRLHSKDYYYLERARPRRSIHEKAAQFIYLNRACWNGLYRENLNGKFNVPIGTKDTIVFPNDDFYSISNVLNGVELLAVDFEDSIDRANTGDLLFVDPPYTTAHNFNGFVKYNQNIFCWEDQIRLRDALIRATRRGAQAVLTNAFHVDVLHLYERHADILELSRYSVISGSRAGRTMTSEALIYMPAK